MSIFDRIAHAFKPVEKVVHQAGEQFNPHHVADAIRQAIEEPVKKRLPGHLSLHEVKDVVNLARPDAIDVDIFVGFGLSLGVELELEFDLGVTWEDPVAKIDAIVDMVENPPETVHQLLDRLWSITPSEIRVYQRLQAVVGEQGMIRWYGDKVEERVVQYIGHRGWLEKKLRP